MPLQDVNFPVDFSGSVNTKTDPKKVVAGDFLLVQDGVFTQPDQIRKRNGYNKISAAIEGGGTLVGPKMLKSFNNQLTCIDSGVFYSYSPTMQAWSSCGPALSVDLLSVSGVLQENQSIFTDCATVGNYVITAHSYLGTQSQQTGNNPVSGASFVVTDLASGAVVQNETVLFNGTSLNYIVKVVAVNATVGAVLYTTDTTLSFVTVTFSGATVTIGSPVTIVTATSSISNTQPTINSVDAVSTATGFVVATGYVAGSNATVIKTYSSTGTLQNLYTASNSNTGGIGLLVDAPTSDIWLYFNSYNGATGCFYTVLSSTLSVILSATLISSSYTPGTFAAISNSSTSQTVYFGNGSSTFLATVSIAGSVSGISQLLATAFIISKIIQTTYGPAALFFRNSTQSLSNGGFDYTAYFQPTYFLILLNNKNIIGRFATGIAPYVNITTKNNTLSTGGVVCNINSGLNGSFLFTAEKITSEASEVPRFISPDANLVTVSSPFIWNFQFDTSRCYKTVQSGQLLLTNGAIISAYDGQISSEWGFNLVPEIQSPSNSSTGGAIGKGNYAYYAVYQWLDAKGNLHQSGLSNAISVTTASSSTTTNTITIQVTTLELTNKNNVTIQLYRTINNGNTYYQVPSAAGTFTYQNGVPVSFSIVDIVSDTVLQSLPTLYTNGGVLENAAPQPSMVLESRFNRLWYVDAENPSINEYYSKTFTPGFGLSPSGFLLTQIQPSGGDIVGHKAMDDKMIIFKSQGILWFSGDGANDSGSGSTLSAPQTIPTGSGLSNTGGIILIPSGIIYQTSKGIMLLDRGLTSHYSDQTFNGAAVEAYSQNVIWDATIIPNSTQVRLLTTTGNTIVYDYQYGRWGIFTNHLGYSSDSWQGAYVYVRTDGSVYQENSSYFLDYNSPYALTVQTSWLAIGSIQGFERMRHLLLLGDQASSSTSGHGIQVSAAYNFNPSFTALNPYTFTNLTGSAVAWQNRFFMRTQKCDSISLLFTEVTTGSSAEYIDFTNLEFNCGVKKGLHKVSSAASVG